MLRESKTTKLFLKLAWQQSFITCKSLWPGHIWPKWLNRESATVSEIMLWAFVVVCSQEIEVSEGPLYITFLKCTNSLLSWFYWLPSTYLNWLLTACFWYFMFPASLLWLKVTTSNHLVHSMKLDWTCLVSLKFCCT